VHRWLTGQGVKHGVIAGIQTNPHDEFARVVRTSDLLVP
jgi:hypothetical protein